jgi:hypothetical protein
LTVARPDPNAGGKTTDSDGDTQSRQRRTGSKKFYARNVIVETGCRIIKRREKLVPRANTKHLFKNTIIKF